jgi:hypothetical protein
MSIEKVIDMVQHTAKHMQEFCSSSFPKQINSAHIACQSESIRMYHHHSQAPPMAQELRLKWVLVQQR